MHEWPTLAPKPTRRQVIREEIQGYLSIIVLAGMAALGGVGGFLILEAARTPVPPIVTMPVTNPVSIASTETPYVSISPSASVAPTRWSEAPPTEVPQMQIVAVVTLTPTPKPIPAALPTKSPKDAVPFCGMGSTDGAPCKWSLPPVPTPTALPLCITPVPGDTCIDNAGRRGVFGTPVPAATPVWGRTN